MPITDTIFAVIGIADYTFLLAFVVWTGFVTRKEALVKSQKDSQSAK